jgi:hypothetical protein
MTSTASPSGTVSSITYAQPPDTVTNIFFIRDHPQKNTTAKIHSEKPHLYLWCPNAPLAWELETMKARRFEYKTNIVWFKVRKDGGPDG